jgi:predicted nucleic acid-binding protein
VAKIFLDTNLLVYMFDRRDGDKQAKARAKVQSCLLNGNGVISTQVLQEYASVALVKFQHPAEAVLGEMKIFDSFETVQLTPELIRSGVRLSDEKQLHFWDATILAAAEYAGCDVLYSEDFQAGATYGNLRVENPLL